jgi:hypothetical protein
MQRSALSAPADRRSDATDGTVASGPATETVAAVPAATARDTTAPDAPAADATDVTDAPLGDADNDTVVVHVQLRPRRGATRKCLAALAALAAEHPAVAFAVSGLSKDDRVVRITVGVDLGPRLGVAKFSAQAQAAYAFVSELFTALYDHMPVYAAEPSGAERAAAATLLESAAGTGADLGPDFAFDIEGGAERVPAPRAPGWNERISA